MSPTAFVSSFALPARNPAPAASRVRPAVLASAPRPPARSTLPFAAHRAPA
eukprot:CAMPEP_0184722440 /NCGR_PEP_ID=MMETSP0314-20130426/22127_1 /TAXON_ID=38298 /ORGANISM="Rhodella maculata, Strain CCMP 736" /LENGTH=50 /DNA_ID=CAMNT_0027187039 /DNA_START=53 /DNA_END=201 /DNA_ORIENTATION=+